MRIESGFYDKYNDQLGELQLIADCAKLYIESKWESVSDWSGLEVDIRDNTGRLTRYFVYKPGRCVDTEVDKVFKDMHNPVHTVKGVALDHIDGDFTITINGNQHLWINDAAVVRIASYIEDKLNGK